MLERERQRLIVRLVEERSIVGLRDLVETLDASEATIRRDIVALDRAGELRRVRGGAEALRPRHRTHLTGVPFEMSRDMRSAEKQAIARKALPLLDGVRSLILSAGTTTFEFARAMRGRDLDVLTNSFSIAAELLEHSRCRVTLPGGTIYREHNIIISPFGADAIDSFAADVLFASGYGVGPNGLMETDPLVAHAARKLMDRAERIVILADSAKLMQRSSIVVAPLQRVHVLITDDGATAATLEPLRAAGVDVLIARAAADRVNAA